VYASADFPDAETIDIKPNTSVKTSVSNVILYHVSEAAEKQQHFRQWRRKVKDIIQNHEEKLLQFFVKPLPDDQPLKAAHTLLTKYGKLNNYDTSRQIPQFFKQFITESPQQGTEVLNSYIEELMKTRINEPHIQRWVGMSKQLLDYMRETGDELIRLDQRLQSECIRIDTVVEKISQLVALPNPELEGFQEMMDSYIEKQRAALPELPHELYDRFVNKLGLSAYDSLNLTDTKGIALYFSELTKKTSNYKAAANWMMGAVKSYLNENAITIEKFKIGPEKIAELIAIIDEGKISNTVANLNVFPAMVNHPEKSPLQSASELNLIQESNQDALQELVNQAISKYPEKVTEYKNGKVNLVGLFMGEVMKLSGGKADPKVASKLVKDTLDKL
jgi:hypothetical protein